MKTQISNLRSGQKNQILNPNVDYSSLPKASSHIGHSGTNHNTVNEVWSKVTTENKEVLRIQLFGENIELKANWSLSGKSVTYYSSVSIGFIEKIGIPIAKMKEPYITITFGTSIEISNGKNYYMSICPSLITII